METQLFGLPKLPKPGRLEYHGAGSYVFMMDNTERSDYEEYLNALLESGFLLFDQNGQHGLYGAVFASDLSRDGLCLTLTWFRKPQRLCLTIVPDRSFSPRLKDSPENHLPGPDGAKARLWQREVWYFGSSYVFQLKNGHFILIDGGTVDNWPYLMDFLEEQAPSGEKPAVDAWFFSHGHSDHVGTLGWAFHHPEEAERLTVEAIYFSEPADPIKCKDSSTFHKCGWLSGAAQRLWTTDRRRTPVYRPQTGQVLYFHGFTMEVLFAQDQLPLERFSQDFNDSTTWYIACLEGQRCVITGDGCRGGFNTILETYDSKDFNVEILTVPHHAFNTRFDFADFFTASTALCPLRDVIPARRIRENEYLRQHVKEWLQWGEGTRELVFPYETGSSILYSPIKWRYHEGIERTEQPNLYTRPQSRSILLDDGGFSSAGEVFRDMTLQYGETEFSENGMPVELSVDESMESGSFRFESRLFGWRIIASEETVLKDAMNTFLKNIRWTDNNLYPLPPRGIQRKDSLE